MNLEAQIALGLAKAGAFVMAAGRRPVVQAQAKTTRNEVVPTEQLIRVEHELVRDLMTFIRSYVVMSPEQLLIVALWVVHTHSIDAFEQTPYLAVTSPERQCGKSRLLEVLELLVARPWMTIVPSEAVLYRTIHGRTPTLLLDEVDTIFNPRSADRYEGHRALLNAGHRRGANVPRCVGATSKVTDFRVYCAKVLAGIGTLPDTVADRSIPIRLSRKTREERVDDFRRRKVKPAAEALLARIKEWAEQQGDSLGTAEPAMPDELSDRMQEGCEPLVAVADAAGCGAQARRALVALLTAERLDDQESMRLRLLRDVRAVFEGLGMPRGISTVNLLDHLYAIDEAPWSNYYGRAFDARDLSALLHHYGIGPTTIRVPKRKKSDNAEVVKGYKRDDLHDAWERYL